MMLGSRLVAYLLFLPVSKWRLFGGTRSDYFQCQNPYESVWEMLASYPIGHKQSHRMPGSCCITFLPDYARES